MNQELPQAPRATFPTHPRAEVTLNALHHLHGPGSGVSLGAVDTLASIDGVQLVVQLHDGLVDGRQLGR